MSTASGAHIAAVRTVALLRGAIVFRAVGLLRFRRGGDRRKAVTAIRAGSCSRGQVQEIRRQLNGLNGGEGKILEHLSLSPWSLVFFVLFSRLKLSVF